MIGREVSTAEHAVKAATAAHIYTNKSSIPELQLDETVTQIAVQVEATQSRGLCRNYVPVPIGAESLKYWSPFDN